MQQQNITWYIKRQQLNTSRRKKAACHWLAHHYTPHTTTQLKKRRIYKKKHGTSLACSTLLTPHNNSTYKEMYLQEIRQQITGLLNSTNTAQQLNLKRDTSTKRKEKTQHVSLACSTLQTPHNNST